MKQHKLITPIFAALLSAIGVALFSFSFIIPLGGLPTIRIDLISVPILIGGVLFGKWYGLAIGVIVDIIGFFALGSGPYFIGFTINLALTGFFAGYIPSIMKQKSLLLNRFVLLILVVLTLTLGAYYILTTEEIRLGTQNFEIDYSMRLLILSVMFNFILASIIFFYAITKDKTMSNKEFVIVVNALLVAEMIVIILTPLWIIYLYGAPPYYIGFVSRIVRATFLFPVKVVIVFAIISVFKKLNAWSLESLN